MDYNNNKKPFWYGVLAGLGIAVVGSLLVHAVAFSFHGRGYRNDDFYGGRYERGFKKGRMMDGYGNGQFGRGMMGGRMMGWQTGQEDIFFKADSSLGGCPMMQATNQSFNCPMAGFQGTPAKGQGFADQNNNGVCDHMEAITKPAPTAPATKK